MTDPGNLPVFDHSQKRESKARPRGEQQATYQQYILNKPRHIFSASESHDSISPGQERSPATNHSSKKRTWAFPHFAISGSPTLFEADSSSQPAYSIAGKRPVHEWKF